MQLKHSLVQNQIVESEVLRITLFINWFSYCSKHDYNSYLVSLVFTKLNFTVLEGKFPFVFGVKRRRMTIAFGHYQNEVKWSSKRGGVETSMPSAFATVT